MVFHGKNDNRTTMSNCISSFLNLNDKSYINDVIIGLNYTETWNALNSFLNIKLAVTENWRSIEGNI